MNFRIFRPRRHWFLLILAAVLLLLTWRFGQTSLGIAALTLVLALHAGFCALSLTFVRVSFDTLIIGTRFGTLELGHDGTETEGDRIESTRIRTDLVSTLILGLLFFWVLLPDWRGINVSDIFWAEE